MVNNPLRIGAGRHRARRARPPLVLAFAGVLLAATTLTLIVGLATAHGQPQPAMQVAALSPAAITPVQPPRRLADGSVFVPKDAQRLFDLRSTVATAILSRPTIALRGRLVPANARAASIAAPVSGRIAPHDGGLPMAGARVREGETLFHVLSDDEPAAASKRAAMSVAIARGVAEVETLRAGTGGPGAIEQARRSLVALWSRHASQPPEHKAHAIVAPVTGYAVGFSLPAGARVEKGQPLLQVAAPEDLWLEAAVTGPFPGAGQEVAAQAALPDGRSIELGTLRVQPGTSPGETVLQFAAPALADLVRIGGEVVVYARFGAARPAIVLPRTAIIRGPDGRYRVWRQVEPERFVANAVTVEGLDAGRALVRSGLEPGATVVVRAADLIDQVR